VEDKISPPVGRRCRVAQTFAEISQTVFLGLPSTSLR
jgi:hypothetical protein